MTEFARQWAIRLPDGSLFTPIPPRIIPGIPAMEPRVAIFETEADAENMLEDLRKHAQMVGVSNLGAVLVSRGVGPWGDVDLTGFLAAVEGHANGGDS
ncbi:MAG: hypothetical protein WAW17_29490 [Rhodococcus sp. (in: high G+C Gram-positive bacteria)]|uniref:hypothetical protein n=1 Tax=Rhodococcus sp. TaxID=1831 RepID=UPI003BB109AE